METTITISDLNAGIYSCTTTAVTGTINITYVVNDNITLTNS